jgi:hypothetical protein
MLISRNVSENPRVFLINFMLRIRPTDINNSVDLTQVISVA